MKTLEDAKVQPDVLMAVPAYKALCEEDTGKGVKKWQSVANRDEEKAEQGINQDEAGYGMDEVANKAS